jgi:hypothetical protein
MTIGHQTMFVHREVYARLGSYSLAYRLASDFDFLVRAVRAKEAFVHLHCFIVHFRDSGASARNLSLGLREVRTVLKEAYGAASPEHIKNLLATCGHLFMFRLRGLIRSILGEPALLRLRVIYGRALIWRGKRARKL